MGHKPFLLMAHEFTSSGIGVLRFDERGVGDSDGDFGSATLEDFKSDVKAAIDFLKRRPDIDHDHIGLLGHSIGGVIAPQVALTENISFLILMAAPGINGDELLLQQRADILRMKGLSESQITQSNAVLKLTYSFINSTDATGAQLNKELLQSLEGKFSEQMGKKEQELLAEQLMSPELIGLIRNQPSEYLAKVRCPVLAINGSKDVQVASQSNLNAIESIISQSGHASVDIKEFEGLNHLFQRSETGDVSEYAEIEQTMAPLVLDYMKAWIKTQKER